MSASSLLPVPKRDLIHVIIICMFGIDNKKLYVFVIIKFCGNTIMRIPIDEGLSVRMKIILYCEYANQFCAYKMAFNSA